MDNCKTYNQLQNDIAIRMEYSNPGQRPRVRVVGEVDGDFRVRIDGTISQYFSRTLRNYQYRVSSAELTMLGCQYKIVHNKHLASMIDVLISTMSSEDK